MHPAETDLHAQTIPIVAPEGCCGTCAASRPACTQLQQPGRADAPPPRLSGDPDRIELLLGRLAPQIEALFGHPVSPGMWLGSLSLSPGEARLALAPHLATCHAGPAAELAFDAMRQLLPDTDIYIGELHD
jgi:hypothetical protein